MSNKTPQDSGDKSGMPSQGITVNRNHDGTFSVSTQGHTFSVGTPTAKAKPRRARRGGIVVAGLVAGENLPPDTIRVQNAEELTKRLKLEVSIANAARVTEHTALKELHFSLEGQHTLDVAALSTVAGGNSSPILAHIHINPDDNPPVPSGG